MSYSSFIGRVTSSATRGHTFNVETISVSSEQSASKDAFETFLESLRTAAALQSGPLFQPWLGSAEEGEKEEEGEEEGACATVDYEKDETVQDSKSNYNPCAKPSKSALRDFGRGPSFKSISFRCMEDIQDEELSLSARWSVSNAEINDNTNDYLIKENGSRRLSRLRRSRKNTSQRRPPGPASSQNVDHQHDSVLSNGSTRMETQAAKLGACVKAPSGSAEGSGIQTQGNKTVSNNLGLAGLESVVGTGEHGGEPKGKLTVQAPTFSPDVQPQQQQKQKQDQVGGVESILSTASVSDCSLLSCRRHSLDTPAPSSLTLGPGQLLASTHQFFSSTMRGRAALSQDHCSHSCLAPLDGAGCGMPSNCSYKPASSSVPLTPINPDKLIDLSDLPPLNGSRVQKLLESQDALPAPSRLSPRPPSAVRPAKQAAWSISRLGTTSRRRNSLDAPRASALAAADAGAARRCSLDETSRKLVSCRTAKSSDSVMKAVQQGRAQLPGSFHSDVRKFSHDSNQWVGNSDSIPPPYPPSPGAMTPPSNSTAAVQLNDEVPGGHAMAAGTLSNSSSSRPLKPYGTHLAPVGGTSGSFSLWVTGPSATNKVMPTQVASALAGTPVGATGGKQKQQDVLLYTLVEPSTCGGGESSSYSIRHPIQHSMACSSERQGPCKEGGEGRQRMRGGNAAIISSILSRLAGSGAEETRSTSGFLARLFG
ncbi:hypothetical protein CEUSTIGMA_g5883.t1 [Chlamydomonas eustigma]|uniref:Uncharacterized protein n=1 Tax=Chlamydomonas eustigma TaxID=1157962 RepID=A0A250X6C7_9CHLO|nr:hypothetical protein CEUSTIGMA_g5883.t1 [Chlamydomonas eustigma]|eukprot:GAX78442.1 hypothetical protein CEUSTIGMA_g5883.t1 [Chlamydomonas eustigma]